ncbi:MAG: right-handed parallel beta-helix repeat-containing protein [Clostridia bacterium]|nr:right-handed parallel beta-helix repeat-containing protein [Clostridia bacterium]
MSKTRKLSIAIFALVFALSLVFGVSNFSVAKAAEANDKTVGQFDFYIDAAELNSDITESTEIEKAGGYSFILQGSKTEALSVDGNPKTAKDIFVENGDAYAFTKRIKTNGKTNHATLDRSISFFLDKKATIKVYAVSSSSSDSTRTLGLYKNGTAAKLAEDKVAASANQLEPIVFNTTEAGSYYLAADVNGVNIYFVGITFTGDADPIVRNNWSEVVAPEVSFPTSAVPEQDASLSDDKKSILVNYNGVIGTNGADKIVVYMKKGEEVISKKTAIRYGNSGQVLFTPTASGTYTFEAEAIRSGETATIKSTASISKDFTLVLETPSVRGRTVEATGGALELMVTVSEVLEADEYVLTYKSSKETEWKTKTLTAAGAGEIDVILDEYDVGDEITYKVSATRTSTSETKVSSEATSKVRPQAERDWVFTYFGQSTKADLNTMTPGGNIFDGISLQAAAYDADGRCTGKGGKFTYGGMDGISFYYTKIDASEEDFRIKAKVTVDYLNPTVDGQEGFALLVRDSIGVHGDSAYYYTNSAAAIATKIQYKQGAANQTYRDGLGSRFVTGIKSTTETPKTDELKHVMYPLLNDTIYQGGEYIIELEKINNSYYTRYYEMNYATMQEELVAENVLYHDGSISDSKGNDQLLVIDKEYVYAGFAVARGCDATFSEIEFEATPRSTEDVTILKTPVACDFSISSPTTSSLADYDLVFFANADGLLDVKLNGTAIVTGEPITNYKDFIKTVTLQEGTNTFEATFTPDPNFLPSAYEVMASYDVAVIDKQVIYKKYNDPSVPIYVAPDSLGGAVIGNPANEGTKESPLDIQTALNYCLPGQTIYLMEGTYEIGSGNITIERGNNGLVDEKGNITWKYLRADPEAKSRPVLDYLNKGGGFTVWGNYWHLDGFDITRTAYGKKGMQLGGWNNILENVNSYYNGDTGISVSGKSTDPKAKWPKNNLVLNCTAYMNKDQAQEDADGFAAKLYCGDNNIFRGCIAYCNADDGWDLYAKTESGLIGAVTIEDCVAFGNGFNIDGTATYGNGNGFKMGGESLSGKHSISNSVSFGNKLKGIDSNSCPDIIVKNCTSVYNGKYNYAFYSTKATSFDVQNVISFLGGSTDDVPDQSAPNVVLKNEGNYFNYKAETGAYTENSVGTKITPSNTFVEWSDDFMTQFGFVMNMSSNTITQGNFEAIIAKLTVRNADDSINLGNFLKLKDDAFTSGARLTPIPGTVWGDANGGAEEPAKGCKKGCKSEIGAIDFVIGFALVSLALVVLLRKQKNNG